GEDRRDPRELLGGVLADRGDLLREPVGRSRDGPRPHAGEARGVVPDATDQAFTAVSISDNTSTSSTAQPSRSATICAATVRWPWPCGVVERRTLIPPSGEIAIVQPSTLPDFGGPAARSSGVRASVM